MAVHRVGIDEFKLHTLGCIGMAMVMVMRVYRSTTVVWRKYAPHLAPARDASHV